MCSLFVTWDSAISSLSGWQCVPWVRWICISKNRQGWSAGCHPSGGPWRGGQVKWHHLQLAAPFLSESFPPAQRAWLNGSRTRLQAAGVYGLADPRELRLASSLAVWNRIHEAFSCAGCRRAVISKRGAERAAEGSNYLSCHHLIHHQVWVSAPSKRDKSRTEYPSIVGCRFISLHSNTSPWWALSL